MVSRAFRPTVLRYIAQILLLKNCHTILLSYKKRKQHGTKANFFFYMYNYYYYDYLSNL